MARSSLYYGLRLSNPYSSRSRIKFILRYAFIYAHPSHGGVIVSSPAYVADFKFLGLDPLRPPRQSHIAPVTPIETKTPFAWGQEAEDDFVRRLLLLGAKWYDSEARFNILNEWECIACGMGGENQPKPYSEIRVDSGWRLSEQPRPTMRQESAKWKELSLAMTIDERCKLLKERFGAKFSADVHDYKGYWFLDA
ncbi:MAG: hypothetical protein M1822_008320 [Bathelium mastoideum]|nr:MAG: hypothetical protein M1822_008320 [Bathelium mastoideum]